jgi:peptidoglycan/xylan/chitin deacetylase (PgdA/CDA1 family)
MGRPAGSERSLEHETVGASISDAARIVVVFRNDDPSACSDVEHERRIAELFDRYGCPQTLGVIPFCSADDWHDPAGDRTVPLADNLEMVKFLRDYVRRSGSEIALHGYSHRTHRRSRPSRREYFEFRELGFTEQEAMIQRGTAAIVDALGARPSTFIPPWNRLDSNTIRACARTGYQVVSAGAFAPVDADVASLGANCELAAFPALLAQAHNSDRQVVLVVNYHSRTIRTPRDWELLETAVRLAAESPDCRIHTIAEVARHYPETVRARNEAARNVVPQSEVVGTARARAEMYRRVLRPLGLAKEIEGTFARARAWYHQGYYDRVQELSPRMDRLSTRLLMVGRVGLALAGLALGTAVGAFCGRLDFGHRGYHYSVVAGLFTLIAAAAWQRGTASDTKRETLFAAAAVLAGMACGFGLAEALSALSL